MALPIPEKDAIEKLRERTVGTPYKFVGFVGEWRLCNPLATITRAAAGVI